VRLLRTKLVNFASYAELEFSFENQGLSLIYGDTGAGKSTLLDAVSWILWGVTAKDGAVDDVRSWNSSEPTTGTLWFSLNNQTYHVTRIRGNPKQNDLLINYPNSIKRGKDITETQHLINALLNTTYEQYSTSAYYNEYSSTRNFFDSTAKQRKELFEKIADLSFSIKLAESVTESKKFIKNTQATELNTFNKLTGQRDQLMRTHSEAQQNIKQWEQTQQVEILKLKSLSDSFETNKANEIKKQQDLFDNFEHKRAVTLAELNTKLYDLTNFLEHHTEVNCSLCGTPDKKILDAEKEFLSLNNKKQLLIAQSNPHQVNLDKVKASINNVADKIQYLESQSNPFIKTLDTTDKQLKTVANTIIENEKTLKDLAHTLTSLNQLNDLNIQLRTELLKQNIQYIQNETNRYLETYFDAALRVQFEIKDDNLITVLQKNGYECKYRQLSKGQKCLLRLCFSIAVMKATANNLGIKFNSLFFDEALDGLDTELKLKAFNLFTEIEKEYETILVIDHSPDLQNLFNKKYYVKLNNDHSEIAEA